MGQKKLFLLVCVCSLLNYATVFNTKAHAFEPAQGDGDPVEVSSLDLLQAEQKLADEESEKTATITAEGDFLLPTYLVNSTQESSSSKEIEPTDQSLFSPTKKENTSSKKVVSVSKKTETELPVVMIKQTELIPVSEQMEVEKKLTGSTQQTRQFYNNATQRQTGKGGAATLKKSEHSAFSPANDDISTILEGVSNESENTLTLEKGAKKLAEVKKLWNFLAITESKMLLKDRKQNYNTKGKNSLDIKNKFEMVSQNEQEIITQMRH